VLELEAGLAEDPREQLGAGLERRDDHVLVVRVRAAALCAEAVEDWDADCADEVAVRAAAGRGLLELQAERSAVLARGGEEARGSGRRLERRPRPAAGQLEPGAGQLGPERVQRVLDRPTVGESRHARV